MKPPRPFQSWSVFLLTLLSRIPFIFEGYGREEDAWSQALNARLISETGVYEVSRLPGHPVYELLLAFLWPINHQYWFFNGLSALVSALAVMVFYRILVKLKLPHSWWLSMCFAFVPVFFTAGTYTIDYNFALLFILLSWYSLQQGKIWWAAVFMGIATGIRISSLAFLIPVSLAANPGNFKLIIRYWLLSGVIAILCYIPALQRYGLSFLDFHKPPFPGWASIIYKLTIGVWGIPLLVTLAFLKVSWWRNGINSWSAERKTKFRHLSYAAVISWLLCLLVFARLPFKAEFFIPSLPFLLILLAYLASKRQIQLVFGASLLAVFSFGFDYANPYRGATPSPLAIQFSAGSKNLFIDPVKGPAIIDNSKRHNKSALVHNTLNWAEHQQDSALLIAGWYWPELEVKKPANLKVSFDYYSTKDEILSYHRRGYAVYYLPEINESNYLINAHYLADSLGQVPDPL